MWRRWSRSSSAPDWPPALPSCDRSGWSRAEIRADNRLGLDLHLPAWVEKTLYDDHGRDWTGLAKGGSVGSRNRLAVVSAGQEDPRADDVLGPGVRLAERREDDLE